MEHEKIIVFETAIDHLTGEEIGNALDRLNDMPEVLDAIVLPGIGKKNRPVSFFQALCRPRDMLAVRDAIFRHTHTLGLRYHLMDRFLLPRRNGSIELEGQPLPAKFHMLEGAEYVRPEADGLSELARAQKKGLPAYRFVKNPHEPA